MKRLAKERVEPGLSTAAGGKAFAGGKALEALATLGERLKAMNTFSSAPEPATRAATGRLVEAIEADLVARLVIANSPSTAGDAPSPALTRSLTESDRDAFLSRVMRSAESDCLTFVEELIARGVAVDEIYLDLLAGTAKRLGEMWEADLCDFTDVTIGLCRLHAIVRGAELLSQSTPLRRPVRDARVLLCTANADQHIFGLVLVAEYFFQAGWSVTQQPGRTCEEVGSLLAEQRFDLLGVSVACDASPSGLKAEIDSYRKRSLNRELGVIVGGRLFLDTPQLIEEVGADATAVDAASAPAVGEQVLAGRETSAQG